MEGGREEKQPQQQQRQPEPRPDDEEPLFEGEPSTSNGEEVEPLFEGQPEPAHCCVWRAGSASRSATSPSANSCRRLLSFHEPLPS